MNIIEKLQLLVCLNRLCTALTKGGSKMSGLLQKLDGYKSVAGLLMVVAYYVVPQFTSVHLPDFVLHTGAAIASAGLAHKLEKATGLISVVLDGIKLALGAITAAQPPQDPPKAA